MKNFEAIARIRKSEPACLAIIPDTALPRKKRLSAIKKAKYYNTTIDEIILSEKLISEETYYRLIALKLGLVFSACPPKIIEPYRAIESWNLKITQLAHSTDTGQWLMAPKGHRLEQLLTKAPKSN